MFTQDFFTAFALMVAVLTLATLFFGQLSDNRINNKRNSRTGRTSNVIGQKVKAFQVKTWNAAPTRKALNRNVTIKTIANK